MTEQELKEAVREIYPYDSHFSEERKEFIIRFPDVLVTNTKEHKHAIKNLFVKFNYTILNPKSDVVEVQHIQGPYGTRSTLTEKEYRAFYSHSHLSSGTTPGSWSGFCLGNGNMAHIMHNIANATRVSPEQVFGLLLALPSYVSWESLEGGPYIKIEDIASRQGRSSQQDFRLEYGPYFEGAPSVFPNGVDYFISDIIKTASEYLKLKPSSAALLLRYDHVAPYNRHAMGHIVQQVLMRLNNSKVLSHPDVPSIHLQVQNKKENVKEEDDSPVQILKPNVFDHLLSFVDPVTGEEKAQAIPLERIKDSKKRATKEKPVLEPIAIKNRVNYYHFANLFFSTNEFIQKMAPVVEELTTLQMQRIISQLMS